MEVRFSIGIIHRNGIEKLFNTIDSILKDITKLDEIYVVDNHSSDDSIDKLRNLKKYKSVNIIQNQCNAGYGYACNQVMKKAKGKYFLLCNNDLIFQPGTLNKFYELLSLDDNIGMIGPQLLSSKRIPISSYSTNKITFFSQLDLIGRPKKTKKILKFSPVETLRGACLAVKRELVEDIGMFDDDFYFYHEDTEWCVRVNKSKKWQLMFAPEIKITHLEGASSKNVYMQSRIEFYRSRIIFWKKTQPKILFLILFFWNFLKLYLDLVFYFFMMIVSFGLKKKYTRKVQDRIIVILWLVMGMNKKWGLPDKCLKN